MKYALTAIICLIILGGCNNPEQKNDNATTEVIPDTASKAIPASKEFNKKVNFKRFSFAINATGDSSKTKFTLTPSGYSITNDPITEETRGTVYDLLVSDIDGDDNPEVAVVLSSGEKQEGEVIVYSSNKDRSLSRVNIPATVADTVLTGYNGNDEFLFVGKNFVRRFPVEKNKDSKKLRHMQYRLVKGEAGKQLVLRNVIDL